MWILGCLTFTTDQRSILCGDVSELVSVGHMEEGVAGRRHT